MRNRNLHLNFNNQIRVQINQRELLNQTDSTETIEKIADEINTSTLKFEPKNPNRLNWTLTNIWRTLSQKKIPNSSKLKIAVIKTLSNKKETLSLTLVRWDLWCM